MDALSFLSDLFCVVFELLLLLLFDPADVVLDGLVLDPKSLQFCLEMDLPRWFAQYHSILTLI